MFDVLSLVTDSLSDQSFEGGGDALKSYRCSDCDLLLVGIFAQKSVSRCVLYCS